MTTAPQRSNPPGTASFIAAVLGPAAVAAAAYALYAVSDRLVSIGPLDRAAFGWLVVVPVWVAMPVMAAFLWGRLQRERSAIAALVVGFSIAAITAGLLTAASPATACQYGSTLTGTEWLVRSLAVGAVLGGAAAAGGLLGSFHVRGGRAGRAVLVAGGSGLVSLLTAVAVATVMFLGAGCQRPPVG